MAIKEGTRVGRTMFRCQWPGCDVQAVTQVRTCVIPWVNLCPVHRRLWGETHYMVLLELDWQLVRSDAAAHATSYHAPHWDDPEAPEPFKDSHRRSPWKAQL